VLTINRPASLLGSVAIAGLLVVGLGACSDDPERDESGAVTEGGDESVFEIAVGDCMTDSATGQVSDLPVVPCTEPHVGEVYHTYEVPGDTFPGDFSQVTTEQCEGPAFQEYVGVAYQQSAFVYTTLEPTAQSWEQGDHELVCVLTDPAGNTTGSLRGANR
jgi:hypothetical protein